MLFTLYVKRSCPFSQNAIAKLRKNHSLTIHDVDKLGGTMPVVSALKRNNFIPAKSSHNTVPIIFDHNASFVGGYDQLEIYLSKL